MTCQRLSLRDNTYATRNNTRRQLARVPHIRREDADDSDPTTSRIPLRTERESPFPSDQERGGLWVAAPDMVSEPLTHSLNATAYR